MASFYYKFVLWSLGWLGGCCHGRGRTFTFEVFLGKYRESCQHNLHIVGSLFFLGGVFGGSWRQVGIIGHFLCWVYCLFSDLGLLCLLGRDVGCTKSLGWILFAFICLLGGSVNLGARGAWGTEGWRIVHILYSPKGRGGLNPNLVEGLVPHLEATLRASSICIPLRPQPWELPQSLPNLHRTPPA